MKKKIMAAVLVAAMLLAIFAPVTAQASKPGWDKNGDYWYYYTSKTDYVTGGIMVIGSDAYYFDNAGRMQTGWIKESYSHDGSTYTKWYYAKSSGALATGWQSINGVWYYFEPSAYYMISDGIQLIDGKYYYFYPSGAMGAGWIKETRVFYGYEWAEWYYANSSGELQTEWQKIGDVWYYFDPNEFYMYSFGTYEIEGASYLFYESGAMGTGWCKLTSSYSDGSSWTSWYYAKSNGVLQSGWLTLGGVKYYLDPYSYEMVVGSEMIDGKLCVFSSNGALITAAGWQKVIYGDGSTQWFYTNADGTAVTGWKTIGGKKYYFYPGSGRMANGTTLLLSGTVYVFEDSGALASTAGWKKLTNSGHTLWVYANADGSAKIGWYQEGSTWYYFNGMGFMLDSPTIIGGKINLFKSSGAWDGYGKTGWVYNASNYEWYYCTDNNGTPKTGWLNLGGKWYYLDPSSYRMYCNTWQEIDGDCYYFYESGVMGTYWIKASYTYSSGYTETYWYYADGSGVLQSGWQTINGVEYYFNPDYYVMYADGEYTIGSAKYYFDASGACLGEV